MNSRPRVSHRSYCWAGSAGNKDQAGSLRSRAACRVACASAPCTYNPSQHAVRVPRERLHESINLRAATSPAHSETLTERQRPRRTGVGRQARCCSQPAGRPAEQESDTVRNTRPLPGEQTPPGNEHATWRQDATQTAHHRVLLRQHAQGRRARCASCPGRLCKTHGEATMAVQHSSSIWRARCCRCCHHRRRRN